MLPLADHHRFHQWLNGEDPLPDDQVLQRWLQDRVVGLAQPLPEEAARAWSLPSGSHWLGVTTGHAMAMLADNDLRGMAPAVGLLHGLLDAGISPNTPGGHGRTALHELFERLPMSMTWGGSWMKGMVDALLAAGADPRCLDDRGHPAPMSRAVVEADVPWPAWWSQHPNPTVRACVAPVLEQSLRLDENDLRAAMAHSVAGERPRVRL